MRLTSICEEAIGGLLNQVFDNSNPSVEKLILRESLLGEIKGIKRVFSIVDSKVEELRIDIDNLVEVNDG